MEAKPTSTIRNIVLLIAYTFIAVPLMCISLVGFFGGFELIGIIHAVFAVTPSSIFMYYILCDIKSQGKRRLCIACLYVYAIIWVIAGVAYLHRIERLYGDSATGAMAVLVASSIAAVTALSTTIALIAIRIKRGRAGA
ncbi:MAG: hypothetical protein FWG87_05970 [Defluviitaleaceae bacterium]|nr:hypothetical protein [Defluviitaleaceae bacterium]